MTRTARTRIATSVNAPWVTSALQCQACLQWPAVVPPDTPAFLSVSQRATPPPPPPTALPSISICESCSSFYLFLLLPPIHQHVYLRATQQPQLPRCTNISESPSRRGDGSVGRACNWKAWLTADAGSSPPCGKIFFSHSRLSDSGFTVACICTHIKKPKHWQPHHCLDTRKYFTHLKRVCKIKNG